MTRDPVLRVAERDEGVVGRERPDVAQLQRERRGAREPEQRDRECSAIGRRSVGKRGRLPTLRDVERLAQRRLELGVREAEAALLRSARNHAAAAEQLARELAEREAQRGRRHRKQGGAAQQRPSVRVSSAFVTIPGDTAFTGPDQRESPSAAHTRATASSTWIHGNHWRPFPSRPPKPARNRAAICGSAPPSPANTTPKRSEVVRTPSPPAARAARSQSTQTLARKSSPGAADSSSSASPPSP